MSIAQWKDMLWDTAARGAWGRGSRARYRRTVSAALSWYSHRAEMAERRGHSVEAARCARAAARCRDILERLEAER